jgi:hypothetical protein
MALCAALSAAVYAGVVRKAEMSSSVSVSLEH